MQTAKNKISVLGQEIDNITLDEVISYVVDTTNKHSSRTIATINPEFLVLSQHNSKFSSTLKKFDTKVVDGAGIVFLTRLFGRGSFRQRITGVELSDALIKLAAKENYKVAIIGASDHANKLACQKLQSKYKNLKMFCTSGGVINPNNIDKKLVADIKKFAPNITLVGLGAPKQEYFIEKMALEVNSVYVGVGGTIDFIAGTAKRAPKFMRSFGLEWLWRLFVEPRRWRRILNATIVFPYYFITHNK